MPRLNALLIRSGIGFWLPLVLLGGGLWLAGSAWTQHYLGVANRPIDPLVLVPPIASHSEGILSIRAVIHGAGPHRPPAHRRPFTLVEVIVVQPVPRTLHFYLPVQSPATIEAEMARRLRVPETTIRRLIQYETRQP